MRQPIKSITHLLTGPSGAALTFLPASHDFGYVLKDTDSVSKIITVTNSDDVTIYTGSSSLTGTNFNITSNGCENLAIPKDASCSISIKFHPTTTSMITSVLSLKYGPAGQVNMYQGNLALQGTGYENAAPATYQIEVSTTNHSADSVYYITKSGSGIFRSLIMNLSTSNGQGISTFSVDDSSLDGKGLKSLTNHGNSTASYFFLRHLQLMN